MPSTVERSRGPLLVFGPRSTTYDFGPSHPLTPRRFGPGIDLLRAVGAEPGLAPEPASDDDLLACHTARYLASVKRLSADPEGPSEAGLGAFGDNPAFAGMHDAAAAVAGGSLRAMEAILRGDVEHAFHPGGGLHHAMPERASGFCIYDDPALAVARARRDGLRVLYVDLDVHHGDGVQAIHAGDPGVMTISIHESGRYLFPGTGFPGELGPGAAAGTSVNVPLEPFTGETAWLEAVETIVPLVAAVFGPDVVVSQHGADSHAWDPLAHLRVTTTAMGVAARLVDRLAHRHAGGRWLATGGGGYDAYRVVSRAWALTWLAGAHREAPATIPSTWRERWASEAANYGQAPLPERFDDAPNLGAAVDTAETAAADGSRRTIELVRRLVVPRLLREAVDRRWWSPDAADDPNEAADHAVRHGHRRSRTATGRWTSRPACRGDRRAGAGADGPGRADVVPIRYRPAILDRVDPGAWSRLTLAPRVIPPADQREAHELVLAALRDGARVTAALDETRVVGLMLSRWSNEGMTNEIVALGVAPAARGQGLAGRLVDAHLGLLRPGEDGLRAEVGVAERDPFGPLEPAVRASIARRLLERAGCTVRPLGGEAGAADPHALVATRS